jgi:hypothetical protein
VCAQFHSRCAVLPVRIHSYCCEHVIVASTATASAATATAPAAADVALSGVVTASSKLLRL